MLTIAMLNKLKKMPHHLLIVIQSDCLIQVIDTIHILNGKQVSNCWPCQNLDLHCLQRWGISRLSRTRVEFEQVQFTTGGVANSDNPDQALLLPITEVSV